MRWTLLCLLASSAGVALAAPGPDTAETLVATYVARGNGNGAALAPGGFTTVSTSNVACDDVSGCAIGIAAMVQIRPSGSDWAVCLTVDGTTVVCPYQGIYGSLSGFVVGNVHVWVAHVAQGSHAVAVQVFALSTSAKYAYYQVETKLYKP